MDDSQERKRGKRESSFVSKDEILEGCLSLAECTLTKKQLNEAYNAIFRTYLRFLADHRNVRLPLLCNIKTWLKPAGKVWNPKARDKVDVPDRWAVRVYINQELRRLVKGMEIDDGEISEQHESPRKRKGTDAGFSGQYSLLED